MLKRHEVQVLLRAGHGPTDVSRLAGVDLRTVHRIAAEPIVAHVDDAKARRDRCIGRPSLADPYRAKVLEWLTESPNLKSVELLHRARQAGYQGGKSALYELVAAVRPKRATVETHFEALPGEFSQHDFGHVIITYLGGATETVTFLASKLKYSRVPLVTIVPDEAAESLVRTLVDHFHAFGGLPHLAVFDRASTIVKRWRKNGEVTQWARHFQEMAIELGLGVELCWPYSPEQKGAVENLVGWVKGSFFKQRRFADRADLLEQLAAWLREVTFDKPCRATGVPPAARWEIEKGRLRPLTTTPDELALRFPIHVGPTASVVFQTNKYDVPPHAVGLTGTLYLFRNRVRIVVGKYTTEHERLTGRGQHASCPELRAARLAEIAGRRGTLYRKRQDLFDLGPDVVSYIDTIYGRQPQRWQQHVERLHDLLQTVGDRLFRQALRAAMDGQTFGAEYVAHHLTIAPSDLLTANLETRQ